MHPYLEGLAAPAVQQVDGDVLGVVDVLHLPEQEVLVVRRPDGTEALVPFVEALVPTVDLAGGYIVIDDRPGLLEES